MSGAGKTLALKIFAQIGYEIIDNLPISMIQDVVNNDLKTGLPKRALGFGGRLTTDEINELIENFENCKKQENIHSRIVFLDCSNSALLTRFAHTGLTHPLGKTDSLENNLDKERNLLFPLQDKADILLDTTHLSPRQLMSILHENLCSHNDIKPYILISSFGFKHYAPMSADLIFDARLLTNPYWEPELRAYTGLDKPIEKFLEQDKLTEEWLTQLKNYIRFCVINKPEKGKYFYHIAIGCTGGKHRSVYTTERIKDFFLDNQFKCHTFHRNL